MRISKLPLVILLFAFWGCESPEPSAGAPPSSPSPDPTEPHPEVQFDIRVFADPGQTDSTAQIVLVTEVDIPAGSYVISALSDRDYLGKFQVTWEDTSIVPVGTLQEKPLSMPGWEPFDKVYTPMLLTSTTVSQAYNLPNGTGPFSGRVFFVLEPQCIAYAMDFTVDKEPDGWSSTYGIVYQANPS
ncbi:hypothetical protein N9C70_04020 [Flavobacteriales bacterium]|nr:hypothetical protein [Flavobacteriales bacterium]